MTKARNYEIRKFKIYKNYVFLLTVHEGCAFWTAHEYNGDSRITVSVLASLFQKAHNTQVNGMIDEALAKEAQEFMELTVEQDERSRKLIDSLPEEKRKLIMDQFEQPINPGGEDETV